MKTRTKLASIVSAILFVTVYIQSANADDVGHAVEQGKSKTEACAKALEEAENRTATARIMKHYVNIKDCSCEKDEAESYDGHRWSCTVRYSSSDVGRTIYD